MFLTRFLQHRGTTSVVWLLSGTLLLGPCVVAQGQVKDDCAARLKEARVMLDNGHFDESIAVIKQCLAQSELPLAVKVQAYELLAQDYLAKRSPAKSYSEEITAAIREMLTLDPGYRASQDDPAFAAEVQKVKDRMSKPISPPEPVPAPALADSVVEESSFPKTWHWIAGAAVVGGIVVWLLVKDGTTPPPPPTVLPTELPGPPVRPTQ